MDIDIKQRLDELVDIYNTPDFIEKDPIQFPRRYSHLQDIEIAAFLIATISWGNRTSVLKSAEKMLAMMHNSPYEYIMNEEYQGLGSKNIHRTFFEYDLFYLCHGLHRIYTSHDSLEDIFTEKRTVWEGMNALRKVMYEANGKNCKHLSNPVSSSACKRLNMALRWLVRQDGIVDIGIWKRLSPAELYIPLDTHVAKISRQFGLLKRKMNDRKSVEELTNVLKALRPDDPVIYDFALFGLGENTK